MLDSHLSRRPEFHGVAQLHFALERFQAISCEINDGSESEEFREKIPRSWTRKKPGHGKEKYDFEGKLEVFVPLALKFDTTG